LTTEYTNLEYLIGFIIVVVITGIYIIYKILQRKHVGFKCGYCGRFYSTHEAREHHIQTEEQK